MVDPNNTARDLNNVDHQQLKQIVKETFSKIERYQGNVMCSYVSKTLKLPPYYARIYALDKKRFGPDDDSFLKIYHR